MQARDAFVQACEQRMVGIAKAGAKSGALPKGSQAESPDSTAALRRNCQCAFEKANAEQRATLTAFFAQTAEPPSGARADDDAEFVRLGFKGMEVLSGLTCDSGPAPVAGEAAPPAEKHGGRGPTAPTADDLAMIEKLKAVCTPEDTGDPETRPERCGGAKEMLGMVAVGRGGGTFTGEDVFNRMTDLNDRCRGGSGDDLSTREACGGRDALVNWLKKEGLCEDKSAEWATRIAESGICAK